MEFQLTGKTILVTGASGLFGKALSLRLLQEGCHVRAMVRSREKGADLEKAGAEVVLGDMIDAQSLFRTVNGCQVVFHFAALMGKFLPWSAYRDVNVHGTQTLAEASLEAGIQRFLHTSSIVVYGMDAKRNTDESCTRKSSKDQYADTKLEGEQVVRNLIKEKGLPGIIIQPTQVYGPEDRAWTLTPIELCKVGKMILPKGGQGLIQPLYIDDLVDGLLLTAQKGFIGESYIIGGPKAMPVREFFLPLARLAGRQKIHTIPEWLAMFFATLSEGFGKITGRPPALMKSAIRYCIMNSSYNGDKAKRELGFEAKIPLEDGMKLVEEWYRKREQ